MKKTLFSIACIAAISIVGCTPECEQWAEDAKGTYSGTTACGASNVYETIQVRSLGDCEILVDDLTAEMTSASRFTISSQSASVNGVSGTVKGTGTISASGALNINFNINNGAYTCTFTSN